MLHPWFGMGTIESARRSLPVLQAAHFKKDLLKVLASPIPSYHDALVSYWMLQSCASIVKNMRNASGLAVGAAWVF